nr:lactosylceramide 1,3-N-acetyl-beta-D-glucosaminyltransferase-like [Lytechinus pictus]
MRKTLQKWFMLLATVFTIGICISQLGISHVHIATERLIRTNRTEDDHNSLANFEPAKPSTTRPMLGWMTNVKWKPGTKLDIYDFLINPVDTCKAETVNITLLVLIKSAPGNGQRRDAARRTYIRGASDMNVSARMVFVVGHSESEDERENLQKEAQVYGDILGVSFLDHYYNLTIKLIMGFRWAARFCSNSDFILTMDDDVMVDIVTLVNDLDALPKMNRSKFALGRRAESYSPHRNSKSKWYITEELYPNEFYPPFPFGNGYILSHDVVEKLCLMSKELPARIPFDDVYCGILLDKLGITILNRKDWFRNRHPQKPYRDYFKIELTGKQMDSAWMMFKRP